MRRLSSAACVLLRSRSSNTESHSLANEHHLTHSHGVNRTLFEVLREDEGIHHGFLLDQKRTSSRVAGHLDLLPELRSDRWVSFESTRVASSAFRSSPEWSIPRIRSSSLRTPTKVTLTGSLGTITRHHFPIPCIVHSEDLILPEIACCMSVPITACG